MRYFRESEGGSPARLTATRSRAARPIAFLARVLGCLIACASAGAADFPNHSAAEVPASSPGKPLVLAVHPYLPAPEIQRRFGPLADYLSREMGRPVVVRVSIDYDEQIRLVGSNAVDLAYIGPVPYAHLVQRFGPVPILARVQSNGRSDLVGLFVVRQDSALQSLDQLRGKHLALGDAESTMSSVVPQYVLLQAGIRLEDLGRVSRVPAHSNVLMGIVSGDFDAGAVRGDVFLEMANRGLRVIASTPAVPEHLFVARPELPPADIQKLRQRLQA